MEFVIKQQTPIAQEPTNTWRIVVSQMSGDADAYDENHFEFTDEKQAIAFLTIVKTIAEIQYSGYYRKTSEVTKKLYELLPEEVITTALTNEDGLVHDISDTIYDICGHDVTCEEYLASVDSYQVFWFNDLGVKFDVEVIE